MDRDKTPIQKVAMEQKNSDTSNAESRLEKLQGQYDELANQMDAILTETMTRSNQVVMESAVAHLITSQVFNASNDGIWAINKNHKIIQVNKKLLHLYDKKVEEVIGGKCTDFFPESCPLENDCPWDSIKKGKPVVEQERTLTIPSGERLMFRVDFTPLSDLEGKIIGLVETFNDITEIKRAEEALQHANKKLEVLASEDGLTKLANRRRFDAYLESEWRRQKRARMPISLIMCDVDYFKNYNDTYGHQAGDICLATIADVIKKSLNRVSDMCARYGGEEFVIILSETDISGARYIIEQIRSSLEEKNIPHSKSDAAPYVTISCGIASTIPQNDIKPETLIEAADKMLYLAKQQGRNCVVTEEENSPR